MTDDELIVACETLPFEELSVHLKQILDITAHHVIGPGLHKDLRRRMHAEVPGFTRFKEMCFTETITEEQAREIGEWMGSVSSLVAIVWWQSVAVNPILTTGNIKTLHRFSAPHLFKSCLVALKRGVPNSPPG